MSQLATATSTVSTAYGRVYAVNGTIYSVTTLDDTYDLQLALSCLLVPVVGDTVLFTTEPGFIVAILSQAKAAAMRQLQLPANTTIAADTLSLQANFMQSQGQTSVAIWQQQTSISDNHKQISNNLSVKTLNRHTEVQQHDELHAGSQRLIIAHDWRVRAQDTDIRAKRQASIDGKQVRLG